MSDKIHVWVPDFAGATGGIQTFSRFLVRGLKDCCPGAELRVFVKNDASAPEVDDRTIVRFDSVGTWPGWQRTAAFTWKLLASAYRDRPELIVTAHVNFAPVAYWLRKLFGIPFFVIGHGVEIWETPDRGVASALRHATQLLAVSNFTRNRMSAVLNLPADRISLLPDTFDADAFVPGPKPRFLLKRYGIAEETPVIFTLARLEESEQYKGYDKVLAALPEVRKVFPGIRYILGGRGSDRARLIESVAKLELEQTVIFAGYIPEHELRAHYNLCDVFAMPSKGEGFGIVFLEALGCGKPVIAGNKDGSVDAVLNGKLGVLVDPDSVEEIANALVRVLGHQPPSSRVWRDYGEPRRTEDGGRRTAFGPEGPTPRREDGGQRPTSNAQRPTPNEGGTRDLRNQTSDIRHPTSDVIHYQPEELRREVIEAYGYERFQHRLAEVLEVRRQTSDVGYRLAKP